MTVDLDALVLKPIMGIFGEQMVWITPDGLQVSCVGVFTEAFSEAKFSAGESVSTDRPRIGLRSGQFAGRKPAQGDVIRRGGVDYIVSAQNDDSIGHLHLTVMLAQD